MTALRVLKRGFPPFVIALSHNEAMREGRQ
ncbi:hypothetical protein DZA65_02373 [Dickeya dianthicola]|nr:hypothetical protein DZA65_02373 [Dickeya dianthicola]